MRFIVFSILIFSSRLLVAEDHIHFSSPDLQHIFKNSASTGIDTKDLQFANLKVMPSKSIVNQLLIAALKSTEALSVEGFELGRFNKGEASKLNRMIFGAVVPRFCTESTGDTEPMISLKECIGSWKEFLSLFRFASTDVLFLKVFGREGKLSDVIFFLASIYPTKEHLMIRVTI